MRNLRRFSITEPIRNWWAGAPVWARVLVIAIALAFAILYPITVSRYWQSVLFYPVGVYILLALGLNVVVGQAGLLDLGYVAFYAVGAYTTAKITTDTPLNSWEVLVLAILLAMVSGVILGGPTLRLRGDYLAIVTLGFGEIVRIIATNTDALGQSRGIVGIPHPPGFFGIEFGLRPLPYYYLTLAAILLAILMVMGLNRSRVGRAWAAIREDEDAAEAMGVPTFRMKLWAFAIGAVTGAVGGWVYASRASYINPDNFTLFVSIFVLCAVVLGGMGSIPGVIAGAFAVAFLPEYLRDAAAGELMTGFFNRVLGAQANNITEFRVLLFGVTLVLMMIFRPQGLLPSRVRAAELAEASATAGLATGQISETITKTAGEAPGGAKDDASR
jgi:branched-chain amino acid transport system permease protein